jgi:hypothetical protein
MNADVQIFVEQRLEVAAVPTAALRTERDIETTAEMVGISAGDLRDMLSRSARGLKTAGIQEADIAIDDMESGEMLMESQYWVLAVNNDDLQPLYIATGVTDLDYSEVLAGLDLGTEVLLLPSSGMVRSQQRTQNQLTRMSRIAGFLQRGK